MRNRGWPVLNSIQESRSYGQDTGSKKLIPTKALGKDEMKIPPGLPLPKGGIKRKR
jgi:hypothetical protein